MTTWWCELAWLGGEDATPGVVLEAAGGRFTAVVPRAPRPVGARALRGLTVPGLVNAHSHAFHRALRGRSQRGTGAGSFWTWREDMYRLASNLDPDAYQELATAVYGEMALAGVTTVGEFHYLHHDPDGRPYPTDAMGEALVAAAETAGVRLTLIDTCYLTGGIDRPLNGVQRRFGDGDVTGWQARVERRRLTSELVRSAAAVHSVRAVPRPAIAELAAWARGRAVPLHAHVSEQPAENDACLAAYARTPTQVLADAGAVDARFTAVHATHLTPGDLAVLGGAGASVCVCPTTERDLADGIGPTAALRDAGARLCLGTDSHAVIDLWEEARAVELDERLATGRRGSHTASDLLAAATAGGARALGWQDAGRLVVGAPADLCTVRLDGPTLAGTVAPDGTGAAAAVVFAARSGDVTDVVVAGRPVVADGEHLALGSVGRRLDAAITRTWEAS